MKVIYMKTPKNLAVDEGIVQGLSTPPIVPASEEFNGYE